MVRIGNDWDRLLADEWGKPYYQELREYLRGEYQTQTVYPPSEDIFNALKQTPYEDVRVVILGQDPYHEAGQAQGLSFSVPYGMEWPPSLVNIIKELEADIGEGAGGPAAAHSRAGTLNMTRELIAGEGVADENVACEGDNSISGVLVPWTRQGVLLLNTTLTVRAHPAGSHKGHGWETFTDRLIELLAEREKPLVFILWGANAGAKRDLILRAQDRTSGGSGGMRRHLIIQAPHPSPLSAYRGFFGGRYFSRCNYFLEDNGLEKIDWRL